MIETKPIVPQTFSTGSPVILGWQLGLRPGLLVVPMLLMLAIVFVVPIGWFMIKSLHDSPGSVVGLLGNALSSPDVRYVLWTTLWWSTLVTFTTLCLAYPIAYVLAQSAKLSFTIILICIIVPYFTSVIVRTYSWMIILGSHGLVNEWLLKLGLTDHPLPLLYNKLGTVIGMTYVLLPYLVLTLLSTMKGIDRNLLRAAHSLGASRFYVFRRIYLPLSAHGIWSGSLIVFILAVGSFVTPALMGGPSDVLIAMLIQQQVELTLNWPAAAALSLLLLGATLLLYAIYCKLARLDRMFA